MSTTRKGKKRGSAKRNAPESGKGETGKSKGRGGKGTSNSQEVMRDVIRGKCAKLTLALLMELKLTFSSRHNASYDLSDICRVLLAVCNRDGGASSVGGQYLRSKLSKGGTKLPSRSWVLGVLKESRHYHMLIRCRHMIRRSVLQARRRGMLRKSVDVSVDMRDIPFYGKVMDAFCAARYEGKKGTTRFNRLSTLHCMVNGSRLTLGVEVVRRGESGACVLRRLLETCRRNRITFSSITLDRGFYSVDVINPVKETGIRMVMPAVKHEKVKGLIKEYDAGKLDAISTHTITSKAGETASYTLVIKRKKQAADAEPAKPRGKRTGMEDRYHVFATSMSDSWIGGDPDRAAEFYRKLWGMENSYKCYEQMKPRTTTSHTVRIVLWFIPFLLYSMWILTRFMTGRRRGFGGWRPPYTLQLFTTILLYAALNESGAQRRRPPDQAA